MLSASGIESRPPPNNSAHPFARRVVGSMADLALVLDSSGTIVDVWLGETLKDETGWMYLIGRKWVETVLPDSRRKVAKLRESLDKGGELVRPREINQQVDGLGSVPVRFGGFVSEDKHFVLPGQDLRTIAELQQRLVSSQQAMDLEYRRLRQADTRYRVLFHVCSEGALIVQGDARKVVEANPAAASILGQSVDDLQGKKLLDLFAKGSRDNLLTLLGAVEAGGTHTRVQLEANDQTRLMASASMFRQAGVVLLLVRFWPADGPGAIEGRESRMLHVLEALPDGFVVIDEDRDVLSANSGFCEMVQRADESHVVGNSFERWFGRPGLDLNIVLSNLREHGVIRNFATVVRGDFGAAQEAVVTAVTAKNGGKPCYGFLIRPVSASQRVLDPGATSLIPRSVDQLRELVGRVSLKEIVQESTDLIERLCIEAALDISGNNRAAAAQVLGLSRQSLYSKLRRHGLGDLDS
ncbi:MAG: transcriptional regulator PpsR [Myxococcota bacterium]